VGTGDYAQAVEPIYLEQGLDYAAAHHMNAHNAFLQMAVMLGAVGLLLLLFWWGTSMWAAWRLADWGLVCSMLLVLFHGLFESVLELQQGIVAVVFLSSMAGGVLNSPASRTS
jgi:O-antigen ligase